MSREFWKELNAGFKPDEPALQQAWRVARPYSPVEDIIKGLVPVDGTGLSVITLLAVPLLFSVIEQ